MFLSKRLSKLLLLFLLSPLLLVVAVLAYYFFFSNDLKTSSSSEIEDSEFEIVAQNLRVPWDIVFLPNGDMLITQRNGILVRKGEIFNYTNVDKVVSVGEGGLMGITLHPDFENNRYIYLYLTVREEDLLNRVVRYRFENNTLSQGDIILDNIPAGQVHNGGIVKFGPDGLLYITTGDAGNSNNAQDLNSLAGKILRITDEGSIPSENPFEGSPVYSYGHRNSQGLTWDDENNLWSTEHGRSGLRSGYDEINKIEAGGNYGWPTIQGSETRKGMISPVLHSGATTTWAPGAILYNEGFLFFAGLRGESLYQVDLKDYSLRQHIYKRFGRIRSVVLGPEGHIYFSTSNLDGRGDPISEDDRIIRINPEALLR
jgi:glucose/arabinose dehydrogenase